MRNIVGLLMCLAIPMILLFSTSSEAVENVIVVEFESTGAIVGAYAGNVIAENRSEDLSDPFGSDLESKAVSINQKWENWQNQTVNKISELSSMIEGDRFYYERLAESRSAFYVDENFDQGVARNMSDPMMRDLSQLADSIQSEIESPYNEMLDKGLDWISDPADDRNLRITDGASKFQINDDDFDILVGYRVVSSMPQVERYYFAKSIYLIPDRVSGIVVCNFINYSDPEDLSYKITLTNEARIELNGNYYIDIESGEGVVRGLRMNFDNWEINIWDNHLWEQSLNVETKNIQIWNGSSHNITTYYPHLSLSSSGSLGFMTMIETMYNDITTIGAQQHTLYKVSRGYDSFAEIPPSELITVPDILFWRSELLDEITDPEEALAIMYSYYDWLNRTEFDDNNTNEIEGYLANFTNISLITNMTLHRGNTTYNETGSLLSWSIEDTIFSAHRAIVIPLESKIALTGGEARNVSQDALIIDLDSFSSYDYDHYDGARINRSVFDYYIDVHDLEENGSPVLEGNYTMTNLSAYVEENYGLGLPEARPDDVSIVPPVSSEIPTVYYLYAGVGIALIIMAVAIRR